MSKSKQALETSDESSEQAPDTEVAAKIDGDGAPDPAPAPGSSSLKLVASSTSPATDASPEDQTDAPSAETGDDAPSSEIHDMLNEAAKAATETQDPEPLTAADPEAKPKLAATASLLLLWVGVAVAIASSGYLLFYGAADPQAVLFSLVVLISAGVVVVGVARPDLIGRFFSSAPSGDPRSETALGDLSLDSLAGEGVASSVFALDQEARLLTRRDGVVVYANAAYRKLAQDAGFDEEDSRAKGAPPPRIDRLFGHRGTDASKVYRLCRSARAGEAVEEIVFQRIGTVGGGSERRFQITATPLPDSLFVSWHIRELPIESRDNDALEMTLETVPMPICHVDKAGRIGGANAALRETFAMSESMRRVDDFLLGDAHALVRALWSDNAKPYDAEVRTANGERREALFIPFSRGGVGEGTVYVAIDVAPNEDDGPAPQSTTGDFNESPFGVAVIEGEFGRDARIASANQAFLTSFEGAEKGAAIHRALPNEVIAELAAEVKKKSKGGAPRPVSVGLGDEPNPSLSSGRAFSIYARPVRRRRGGYGSKRTFLYSVEITEQKRLQHDHLQDQKLKAIGNIAGEVAHDFNNLLQVILSSCEDLLLSHPAGDPAYSDLILIRQNSQRAANLTRQLLAYSRKQTLTNKTQSITDLLIDFSRFLDRAVGEKVRVKLKNGRGLPLVRIDTNQFETAIMNLAVNARDAMAPDGGDLTLETEFVSRDDIGELGLLQLRDQDHLLLRVTDTGPGVPEELMAKIFDPFFTTKDVGKGTGLGLSAVQGVIEQMGGAVAVKNADGGGAVFSIYLPAFEAEETEDEAPSTEKTTIGPSPQGDPTTKQTAPSDPNSVDMDYSGNGRILVVEDEPGVRMVVVKTLEKAGYEVAVADDGVEALELLADNASYDLVVTDVMMPEVDGPTMVETARREHGLNAAIVFMSGYAEAAVRQQLEAVDGSLFIQKPFQKSDLSILIRRALHGED